MKPKRRQESLVTGTVTSLDDPERLGRVKVFYADHEDRESRWCRLVAPFAGREQGAFFRPEVGDEVLVAFLEGDVRRPFLLGGLWSTEDPPPPDDGKATENNWRFLRSRSGHIIKLDDTEGREVIEVCEGSGANRIVLDTAENKIRVESDGGDIEIEAGSGTVKVEATTIEIKASGQASLEAGGTLTLKAATVNIN